jgi:hypothetical protein
MSRFIPSRSFRLIGNAHTITNDRQIPYGKRAINHYTGHPTLILLCISDKLGMEKLILKIVVILIVIGMGFWLYHS